MQSAGDDHEQVHLFMLGVNYNAYFPDLQLHQVSATHRVDCPKLLLDISMKRYRVLSHFDVSRICLPHPWHVQPRL